MKKPLFHSWKTCSAAALIALCLAMPALSQEEDQPAVGTEPRPTTQRRTRSTRPPAMIGDFFGGAAGGGVAVIDEFEVMAGLPNPSASGAVVGRVKLAENTSPLPQDRVFLNYSYFDNVTLIPGGVAVNRFVPGLERTFFDSTTSLELRIPFAATLDSDVLADGPTSTGKGEFGNISLVGKALLTSNESLATSAGLQLTLPTASDIRVLLTDGTKLVEVENEAVHLLPFAAALYTPNDSFYAQAFLQFDFDANGNPVSADATGGGVRPVGRLNDPAYLFLDISLGWFMYESPYPSSRLTGITPIVELHYNRSLQSGDAVSTSSGLLVGDSTSTFEALNVVTGAAFQFGPSTSFTVGYTVPVGGGRDQVYDGELRAFFNHYLR